MEGRGFGDGVSVGCGCRVLIIGYEKESEHVIALDEVTGSKLWDAEIKTGLISGIGMRATGDLYSRRREVTYRGAS